MSKHELQMHCGTCGARFSEHDQGRCPSVEVVNESPHALVVRGAMFGTTETLERVRFTINAADKPPNLAGVFGAPSSGDAVHAWTCSRTILGQMDQLLELVTHRNVDAQCSEALYELRVHLEHLAVVHGLCALCFGRSGGCARCKA